MLVVSSEKEATANTPCLTEQGSVACIVNDCKIFKCNIIVSFSNCVHYSSNIDTGYTEVH